MLSDPPIKNMQFSAMIAPSIGTRKIRSKSQKSPSFVATGAGMMLALSSDDEDDRVDAKIEEKRKIFNIADDIELSSDEEYVQAAPSATFVASHHQSQERSKVQVLANSSSQPSKIPFYPVKSVGPNGIVGAGVPTVNVSIASSVDGTDDLRKVMSSLLRDSRAKDLEIKSLRKEISDLEYSRDIVDRDGMDMDDLRHVRIKELSKKAKRLTVSYEKERSVNSQLQARIKELENKLGGGNQSQQNSLPQQSEEKMLKLKAEMKGVKEKLANCIRKVEDERLHNQTLKNEIRNLQKVLQQEVGDNYCLEKLVKGDSNAKGRTEQISILKEKIKELNRKLQSATRQSADRATPTTTISVLDTVAASVANDHNGLYRMELSKRKEFDRIAVELERTKQDLAESRKKNDGLSARIKILENGGKETKSKISLLLKKSETDDQFIQALKEEISKVKASKSKDIESEQAREKINSLEVKIVKLEAHITDLEAKLQSNSAILSTYNEDNTDETISKIKSLVHSQKSELSLLRSGKSKLETALAEEKKNASFLRLQIQRERERPVLGNSTDPHAGKSKKDIIEELKDSVAILSDENQALKVTMQMVSESKMTDLEMYQNLLDQTRNRFEAHHE